MVYVEANVKTTVEYLFDAPTQNHLFDWFTNQLGASGACYEAPIFLWSLHG